MRQMGTFGTFVIVDDMQVVDTAQIVQYAGELILCIVKYDLFEWLVVLGDAESESS